MMRPHFQARELQRSPDGRPQYGLGLAVGYWPCLYAPYVSLRIGRWRLDAWYGLPSYKKSGRAL